MIVVSVLFWFFTAFLALGSLAALSRLHVGIIRSFDFPRIQVFWLGCILSGIAYFLLEGATRWWTLALLVGLSALQAIFILKFTPIWPRQSCDADAQALADTDNHVSVLAANVKKSNREYDKLISYVKAEDPDIAIAVEVDDEWIDALHPLRDAYPHWIEIPKDNGYGICMMSKLDVSDHSVQCHITDDVPSITAKVVLRSGDVFRLYVVHPEPPIPTHDTEGRDSEISHVGLIARDDPLPAVVTGDLNDVAWSTTTRQFQRLSRLLDPRVGRGFFNTFHAHYPMFRWPLDHLFHDQRFRLVSMERGPNIASDHFPVMFRLALTRKPEGEDQIEEAEDGEEEEAKEMIASEKRRDREAIGSHWEDED